MFRIAQGYQFLGLQAMFRIAQGYQFLGLQAMFRILKRYFYCNFFKPIHSMGKGVGARGNVVVVAICYKPEGRGSETR
jgi:hypothetical protein